MRKKRVKSEPQIAMYVSRIAVKTAIAGLSLSLGLLSMVKPSIAATTTLSFDQTPTLVTGTPLSQGAVYRFPSVTAGIDAMVQIEVIQDAQLKTLDDNATFSTRFQPVIAPASAALQNATSYVKFNFKLTPSSTPSGTTFAAAPATTATNVYFSAQDIDGNGDPNTIRELVEVIGAPTTYIANPTLLQLISTPVAGGTGYEAISSINVQNGIGTDDLYESYSFLGESVSTFSIVGGNKTGSTGCELDNSGCDRQNSWTFNVSDIQKLDFGDAPSSFGNAYHPVPTNPTARLGAAVDGDDEPSYTVAANGDGADDDSITSFPTLTIASTSYSLNLTCAENGAFVAGWIDFNKNNTFDAAERATGTCDGTSVTLAWTGISGLTAGNTYARFRIASIASEVTNPTGQASNGEVEDYQVPIASNSIISGTLYEDSDGGNDLDTSEPTLAANITVKLLDGSNNVIDTAITDANGAYTFTGVTNGSYKIQVDIADIDIPSEYALGTPNDLPVTFSGTTITNQNFGFDKFVSNLICINPTTSVFNSSNYSKNSPLQGSLSLSFYSGSMQFSSLLSGSATWSNGVQVQTGNLGSFTGDYLYLQPANASNYLATNNKASYVLSFPASIPNFSMVAGGLNNFDGTTIIASYKGVPVQITAANFSALSIGMTLKDADGDGQSDTVVSSNTSGGVAVDQNTYKLTIPVPVDKVIIVSGKDQSGNNGTVTIGLHSFQYCSSSIDYGDAPDGSAGTATGNYRTTSSDNGPTHNISSGLKLGANLDSDSGTLQNGLATADDTNGTPDDEDAFTTLPNVPSTGSYSLSNVPVTNTTGNVAILHAWVDFNKNGSFEASEYTSATVANGASSANLSWTVPGSTTAGATYARFRLTTQSLTDNDLTVAEDERSLGAASDGEVEDHGVTIISKANVLIVKRVTAINGDRLKNPNDNTPLNLFVDDTSLTSTALNENHCNWAGATGAANACTNTYTLGAIAPGKVKPGDEIEYTIYYLNAGGSRAKQVRICDRLNNNLTFSPNFDTNPSNVGKGITLVPGIPGIPLSSEIQYLTNIGSDDKGELATAPVAGCNLAGNTGANLSNDVVVVDVATSANSADPLMGSTGSGAPNTSYGYIRFKVKVKE